jgi:hypothetical protein
MKVAAKSTEDKTRLDPDAAGGLPPPRRARGLAGRRRVPRRGILGIQRQPGSGARTGEGARGQDRRQVLIAQDADRFARGAGDAPGAADHLGEVYFAMKRQGVELWTDRSGQLDLLRAALEGERAHSESARKEAGG